MSTVDKKIIAVLQEEKINMVQNRLERFLMHVKNCLEQHDKAAVAAVEKAPKSSGAVVKGPIHGRNEVVGDVLA